MRITLKPSNAELNSPAFFSSIYAGVLLSLTSISVVKIISGDMEYAGDTLDVLVVFTSTFIVSVFFYWSELRSSTAAKTMSFGAKVWKFLPTSRFGWGYGLVVGVMLGVLEFILWFAFLSN